MFESWEQELLISLRGLSAWRMYRQAGLHPSLMLEMFPAYDHLPNVHHDAIREVLTGTMSVPQFRGAAALSKHIKAAITNPNLELEFNLQSTYFTDRAFFAGLYRLPLTSQYVRRVIKLASFLVDFGDEDGDAHAVEYEMVMANLWLSICDAVIDVQA